MRRPSRRWALSCAFLRSNFVRRTMSSSWKARVLVYDVPQVQYLRRALVVHKREHIDGKARLQLRLGEEAVQYHLRVRVALELNDYAHAVAVRLVAQAGDALEALFAHLLGHVLDELLLVDLVGQLGDDNAYAVVAELLHLGARADNDLALAGGVGGADAAAAHDDAAGGEVGPGDVLHEVGERGLGVLEHADAGVYDLGEVVRRDIRRHADGDAARAVDEQVGEASRKHAGLAAALVEVGVPVDRVLLYVAQHLVGDAGHPRLRVSVGRGGVAVDGAEVAVAVHERVAHGEVLREAHERVVYRGVAMRMIAAQHVADAGRRFLEGLVRGQAVLVHGVEYAPVHGLEPVPHIRQRAGDNDAHGVVDKARLHLAHYLRRDNMLLREHYVLGFVVFGHRVTTFIKCGGVSRLAARGRAGTPSPTSILKRTSNLVGEGVLALPSVRLRTYFIIFIQCPF